MEMCFHGNQHQLSIKHPFDSLYSKYNSFILICLPDMNSPAFASLDDIYCTFLSFTSIPFIFITFTFIAITFIISTFITFTLTQYLYIINLTLITLITFVTFTTFVVVVVVVVVDAVVTVVVNSFLRTPILMEIRM